MAVWDVEVPSNGEDANTIHTLIQAAKASFSAVMKCNDATFDAHNVCQADEDGLHISSEVGFVRVSTWADRLLSPLNEGALQYIISPTVEEGLYLIVPDSEYERVTAKSHLELESLDDNAAHPDLLELDGTGAMAVELRVQTGVAITDHTYGTDDSDAINPTHVPESWYVGHGEDAIVSRHLEDGLLSLAAFDEENLTPSGGATWTQYDLESNNLYGWPSGQAGTPTPVDDNHFNLGLDGNPYVKVGFDTIYIGRHLLKVDTAL